jgi:hypothetical protein
LLKPDNWEGGEVADFFIGVVLLFIVVFHDEYHILIKPCFWGVGVTGEDVASGSGVLNDARPQGRNGQAVRTGQAAARGGGGTSHGVAAKTVVVLGGSEGHGVRRVYLQNPVVLQPVVCAPNRKLGWLTHRPSSWAH